MMELAVQRFESGQGARVYRMPLELFPGFWGFAYLVISDGFRALIDCGSGLDSSNSALESGLSTVCSAYGEDGGWRRLTHVLITHGHIDHHGGLRYVRSQTDAPVGVHELDRRVLTRYEERVRLITHRLRGFLVEAGVEPEKQAAIIDLYLVNKQLFSSVPVDLTYEAEGMRVGPLTMTHVPGHCPGQVVMQLDDILLVGDQVLSEISPHQSPESLSDNTGLGHYLESLERIRPLSTRVRWTLGGHQEPIRNLGARLDAIESLHRERLQAVLDLLTVPRTIAEISARLFPEVHGYNVLLALEETGAHVEYLAQRGQIGLESQEAIDDVCPVPLRYVRADGATPC
ncbi:MAG: MBL fold metallo-hydrolase [Chloroflexi bacterium]|nr:MBL fold metallo-hydrolase [Chloroflexota bacterium]